MPTVVLIHAQRSLNLAWQNAQAWTAMHATHASMILHTFKHDILLDLPQEPRATPQLSDADLGQAIVGLELSDFQHKAFQDFRDCRHRLALWSIKSQGSYAHALSLAAAAQRQMMQMREVVQELEARGTPRPPHYLAAWTFYYWQHVDAAHLVARWPPPSSS